MYAHTQQCSAVTGTPDLCTCGAAWRTEERKARQARGREVSQRNLQAFLGAVIGSDAALHLAQDLHKHAA
jgi:hypothetical protein